MKIVKYKDIGIPAGSTIDLAVQILNKYRSNGELVCINFNGVDLYSDEIFTVDDAYEKITGVTKKEYEKKIEDYNETIHKREQEYKDNFFRLVEYYKQQGRKILSKEKWKDWDEIVPIRLSDLYQGMELGSCLDIVKLLNEGGTLDEAKEKILNQNHSGMSFSLVCHMVEEFADGDRGKEFRKYVLGSE